MQTISDEQDEFIDCNDCEQVGFDTCRLAVDSDDLSLSPRSAMEHEKRIRREIANSNERRRMQSINAGFQTLRDLLPQHEGEKLSKAAILQQTSEFIYSLEQEKTRLLAQNCQLKRLLAQQQQKAGDTDPAAVDSPLSAASASAIIAVRRSASQESTADSSQAAPGGVDAETGDPAAAAAVKCDADEPLSDEDVLAMRVPSVFPARSTSTAADDDSGAAAVAELRLNLERERQLRVSLEQQLHRCHQLEAAECAPGKRRRVSPSPPLSPACQHGLLLTAAPDAVFDDGSVSTGLYASATTSRQNLDTIVEAIRHLEGDHLFQDSLQESAVPLATCPARGTDVLSSMELMTETVPVDASLSSQTVPVVLLDRPPVESTQFTHHRFHHHHQGEHVMEATADPSVELAADAVDNVRVVDDSDSSLQEAPLALTTHRRHALSPIPHPHHTHQHPYIHLMCASVQSERPGGS